MIQTRGLAPGFFTLSVRPFRAKAYCQKSSAKKLVKRGAIVVEHGVFNKEIITGLVLVP